jgi:hypothetical protein
MNKTWRFGAVLGVLLLLAGAPASAEESGKPKVSKKERARQMVNIGARIHTLFTYTDRTTNPYMSRGERPDPSNSFAIDLARIDVTFDPGKRFDAKLQIDLQDLFSDNKKRAGIRDAWVRIKALKQLKVKVGQFKRPFSRLELRSRGALETIDRGLHNEWIIEELGYGDRDVGLQLEGRFGKRKKFHVKYAAGVFNGSGKNAPEVDPNGAKDVAARVELGFPVGLSLGLNGSFKFMDQWEYVELPDFGWMTGADARFRWKGLRIYAEGLFGLNHNPCLYSLYPDVCEVLPESSDIPYSWSVMGMVSYKFEIWDGWDLDLQPVVKAEMLVPDDSVADGRIVSVSPGINLFIQDWVRVMVHGEFIRPGAGVSDVMWLSENRFMTQVAFDL